MQQGALYGIDHWVQHPLKPEENGTIGQVLVFFLPRCFLTSCCPGSAMGFSAFASQIADVTFSFYPMPASLPAFFPCARFSLELYLQCKLNVHTATDNRKSFL